MRALLSSPRFLNRLMWACALIFVAGVVTFGVVLLGDKDESASRRGAPAQPQQQAEGGSEADAVIPAEATPSGPRKTVPLSAEARRAAGEFILAAVTREDLAKGWELIHPELKAECQCSRAEWMTGNIPIQPYPGEALEDASFAIEESYADEAWLEVALLPKDGSGVPSEIFKIGLKRVGEGSSARWLVTYWAPRVTIPVPVDQ